MKKNVESMEPIINDTTAFLIKFKKQKFGSITTIPISDGDREKEEKFAVPLKKLTRRDLDNIFP